MIYRIFAIELKNNFNFKLCEESQLKIQSLLSIE